MKWQDLDLDRLAETVDGWDLLRFTPGLPDTPDPGGDPVPVRVLDIGAGAWAQFDGTLADGTPIVMSGAVVGGPDTHGADVVAVAVRDYQEGNPDVIIYLGADAHVLLCDPADEAERRARSAHGRAPVFGPVVKATGMKRVGGVWVDLPPVHNPSPVELAALEHGGPDRRLSSVHRGHLPIDPELHNTQPAC